MQCLSLYAMKGGMPENVTKELNHLLENGIREEQFEKGGVGDIKAKDANPEILNAISNVRDSDVCFVYDKKIINYVANIIQNTNRKAGWNFQLSSIDGLQYTRYREGQYYHWHTDEDNWSKGGYRKREKQGLLRKLSITILLNDDFEGGELEFGILKSEEDDKQFLEIETRDAEISAGEFVVFHSDTFHRVKPVISGVRRSLVAWCLGKQFR